MKQRRLILIAAAVALAALAALALRRPRPERSAEPRADVVMETGGAPASAASVPHSYERLVADAKREGALSIYSATDAREVADLLRDFGSLYPEIRVEYADLNSTELYSRFIAEVAAKEGTADLLWSSAMDLQMNLAPEKRDLGLVFQSYALWPHMTVSENVAYGLKVRRTPAADLDRQVKDVLAGVGLGDYGKRYPSELSGGQQQRVALVYRPPLILLDEPLSNLDAKLREEARIWLRELIKKAGLTAIFVTHDQVEAMAIADRIMLLDGGRMVQDGTPEDLYTAPQSLFAADFMGINNTIEGRIAETVNGHARIDLGGFSIWGVNKAGKAAGDTATAVIRIEQIGLVDDESDNRIRADLETSAYLGGRWEHIFRLAGQPICAVTQRHLQPGVYGLKLPKDEIWIF